MILVINAGSSSIKYSLYSATDLDFLGKGLIEEVESHRDGFMQMIRDLQSKNIDFGDIKAIGHRVVHGGESFFEPTLITDEVLNKIIAITPLAPLHNPANIEGIRAAMDIAVGVKNFAIFDTAFHQSMPEYAYKYPIPPEFYIKSHVRRYGFHGTSHHYVATKAAEILGKSLDNLNLITLHLGNGASACAIEQGKSIDTSMGLTPLEGLMMGTRSGSIDPSIIGFLVREYDLSIEEIENTLNKKSGLLAVAKTNDMRTIIERFEQGDKEATLALEMFIYRVKKQLGEYMAILDGVDAVIFTGGIGEHSRIIQQRVCEKMSHLGIELGTDDKTIISSSTSSVAVLVIPTNEELQIAKYVKQNI